MKKKAKLNVILVTGRTIEQGVGKEHAKSSRDYADSVAVCFLHPTDLERLGINEKTPVRISTAYGSVVLKAHESNAMLQEGVIFVPYGPWANVLVNPETSSIGMPSFKGINAEIAPAFDEAVPTLEELLRDELGR